MAKVTNNLSLITPEISDNIDPGIFEYNFETLDKALACVAVTVPSTGWSSSAPYTQTVSVSGMTAEWIPGFPVLVSTGVADTDLLAREALSYVCLITSGTGTLTFTCYEEQPVASFTVRIPQLIGG